MARVSISTKLLLGFLGLLVLALVVLGTASTLWFVSEESQSLDQFLRSEARAVANRLEGIVEGLSFEGNSDKTAVKVALLRELKAYISLRLNEPMLYKTTLVILDEQGGVLARSNAALDLLGPGPRLRPGEERSEDVRDRGPAFRMVTKTYPLGTGTWGTFRIACLLSTLGTPLVGFLTSLGMLLGGCLVALSFLGFGLLRLTLGPIRSMTLAASALSEQNLGARIPLPPGNDDVTRLARTLNSLLARLETDHAFQSRLVSDLTHQIKTPLTILRGRNELGLANLKTQDEWCALAEDNLADIDALGNLLNTLLSLARFDSRIDRVNSVEIDVKTLVEQLGEELEPLWASKDQRFQSGGPPLVIQADREAFRQILVNLYDNSWKFSPPGTLVTTHWNLEGANVKIVVANQSPPIPETDLDRVFQRFYRVPGVEGAPHGSGLGLSIVRSLVELQGGRVRGYNRSEGGVAFEILWPYGSSR